MVKKAISTKTTKKEVAVKAIEATRYDLSGKETGKVSLPAEIFGQKENKSLISQYIYIYLQNQRQGTVSTKTRSEVVGTTKKMYKQKGTGRARHGSKKAPIFVGGGVTFGPKPVDYNKDLNKKQKKKALYIALSSKANDKKIRVLELTDFDFKPETKKVFNFLKVMKLSEKKSLFILPKVTKNGFLLSIRNIEDCDVIQYDTLNPYEVLNHDEMIFVGDSHELLYKRFFEKNEN